MVVVRVAVAVSAVVLAEAATTVELGPVELASGQALLATGLRQALVDTGLAAAAVSWDMVMGLHQVQGRVPTGPKEAGLAAED